MNLYEELENRITAALRAINKLDGKDYLVIPSHQNNPEPKTSYLSVYAYDMLSQRVVNSGKLDVFEDANGVKRAREHIISHYQAKVQLTFIGPDAGENASLRHANMMGALVRHELAKHLVGPVRQSSLRRNPQPRGTKWVDEFAFDLTVSYAVATTDETNEWVEKITVHDNLIQVTN